VSWTYWDVDTLHGHDEGAFCWLNGRWYGGCSGDTGGDWAHRHLDAGGCVAGLCVSGWMFAGGGYDGGFEGRRHDGGLPRAALSMNVTGSKGRDS
jgi:hypothetical protein